MAVESIKKNYVYNTLYQILTLVTPLITAPYVSRVLGRQGVGIYSYTNSIVTYFTLFAALGTASYGQREIAMHRDSPEESSRLFWEIELLSVATTGAATAGWVVWILLSTRYTVYYIVLTMTLVAAAFDISWYFGGFEHFKYIVIRNTIVKLSGIALLFLLVRSKNDTIWYVGIMAATGLLGNLSMWTYLPKMLTRVDRHSIHPFRKHLRQTLAYFIPTIATSVYTVLDKTMIGAITKTPDQNGYYEQATKIIRMMESLLFSLNTVMSARQSYLFSNGRTDEIKDKINRSFDYLFALAIPLMFGIMAVARNFVPWFFGKGYGPVVRILCVMSPLLPVISISNILGSQYLTPSGQRARSSKGIITGACVNFLLNSLLIPRLGAEGATIASVAAELVISVIYVHMSRGFVSWRQIGRISSRKLVAGFAMFWAVSFIGRNVTGSIAVTVVQILAGAALYGLLLVAMRDTFAKSALKYLRARLSR